MTPEELVAQATAARENAHAPYSRYSVGAALLSSDGRVFPGANVENASYGLTVCAERAAFFAAVSAGATSFTDLAVVTQNGASMCGACRQVAREFSKDLRVHLAHTDGTFHTRTLEDLLPESFGPEHL